MIVNATDLKNNLGKYLRLSAREEIVITSNGRYVAKLIAYEGAETAPAAAGLAREGAEAYTEGGVQVMKFMAREAKPEAASKETFTYGDYLSWPDDERWELIDGVPYNMSPGPNRAHQEVSGELFKQIAVYLTGKTCKVYAAPFDVRLPKGDEEDEQIETAVQPDLVVVCDLRKLDERGCKGAPDWVVEIISPHTAAKDMKIKRDLYERVGVREYWLVDPGNKTVQIYAPGKDGRYGRPEVYAAGDQVHTGIFSDLIIDLAMVFGG
ncbi:MAG: type II toxin-antitoxin system prevent-host-death family antitoxin [Bacteroidota bacterium]